MNDSVNHNVRLPIACNQCAHFYITFDPRLPYGCRSMGFKSYRLPEHDVRAATGHACLSFTPKETRQ
ncbi:hypothetical protein [Castellaniella sp.]|uniref:hypothetical protein n=1 Tax=Castellaniella sp. TaxID=1955812 RepID=UPI002AFF8ABE|nr:hypothetical protein [Castellaniella sp.]